MVMYVYMCVYVYMYIIILLLFKLIAAWIAWPDLSFHSRHFLPIIFSSVCHVLFFIYRINIATIMKYMFSIFFS